MLIILKNIESARFISQKLSKKLKVIEYFISNEKNLHEKVNNIKEPTVIVATNLAGRGTDIKLSKKLEK